ncbi:hypothetical protein O9929_06155 [Vibrio lentus]|nr:hypothetical protein [Vibrio lentus]
MEAGLFPKLRQEWFGIANRQEGGLAGITLCYLIARRLLATMKINLGKSVLQSTIDVFATDEDLRKRLCDQKDCGT